MDTSACNRMGIEVLPLTSVNKRYYPFRTLVRHKPEFQQRYIEIKSRKACDYYAERNNNDAIGGILFERSDDIFICEHFLPLGPIGNRSPLRGTGVADLINYILIEYLYYHFPNHRIFEHHHYEDPRLVQMCRLNIDPNVEYPISEYLLNMRRAILSQGSWISQILPRYYLSAQ